MRRTSSSQDRSAGSRIPRPEGIFDPVARALEVIGDRWTLVLVRQLLDGNRGFQELRQRTGIAPRVLSSRLRELVSKGFVTTVAEGSRSVYALTEQGRSLEPIVVSIGRWWIQRGLDHLGIDADRFTETSALSVLEALPFMVREDRAQGVDLTFEIRLEGPGGGVWAVRIHDGHCTVRAGFADRADVRYTADARAWCGVALGLLDAREVVKQGLMSKEGGREAMDHYFHQVSSPSRRKEKAL
ncbi:MAG: winged helix-turn-helix transcriptional regulator [Myxococcota bacterium]|nr:winged helix-turn-helix transcriptional regulator [Myxococcota bacterium]